MDDLRWQLECIRTVGGIISGWALVHVPSLAARLVHAVVKLLAAAGTVPRPEPETRAPRQGWGFLSGAGFLAPWDSHNINGGQRRGRGKSVGGDDRRSSSGSVGSRGRDGVRLRGERAYLEEKRLGELQDAGLEVGGWEGGGGVEVEEWGGGRVGGIGGWV